MSKTKNKSDLRTKPVTGNQGIEVLIYVDYEDEMGECICRYFSMNPSQIIMNSQPATINKKGTYRRIIENTSVQIASGPNPDFLKVEMFLFENCCYHPNIMALIREYPLGGTAVIAHMYAPEETLDSIQFIDPWDFEELTRKDFSILQFQSDDEVNTQPLAVLLTQDEIDFLDSLVEIVENSDNYICNLSNNEIAEALRNTFPTINNEWIARTLGKFQHYNFIGSDLYGRDGYTWFRDIYLGEIDWEMILPN